MKKFLLALAFVFFMGGVSYAGDISLSLTWKDNSNNEDGFGIEQSSTPEFTVFNQIGVTAADVATFSTGTVAPNTQYCYRVYAFNNVGHSGYSNVACVTTPSLPNGPTDLIINVTIAP
jgi:titin